MNIRISGNLCLATRVNVVFVACIGSLYICIQLPKEQPTWTESCMLCQATSVVGLHIWNIYMCEIYVVLLCNNGLVQIIYETWKWVTLSPCIDSGWQSSALFLFWWQTLSSPCKHLDYAVPYIHSCYSFYLEFTSFADSIVTRLCSTSCVQLIFLTVVGLRAPQSRFLEWALYKFSKWMNESERTLFQVCGFLSKNSI